MTGIKLVKQLNCINSVKLFLSVKHSRFQKNQLLVPWLLMLWPRSGSVKHLRAVEKALVVKSGSLGFTS